MKVSCDTCIFQYRQFKHSAESGLLTGVTLTCEHDRYNKTAMFADSVLYCAAMDRRFDTLYGTGELAREIINKGGDRWRK